MGRFFLLIFVVGMMLGFSPNIEGYAAGSQASCDSLEAHAESLKSDRARPLAFLMSQLRSCRPPGSEAYLRTYAWEARILYHHQDYDAVLEVVEAMSEDSTADAGATFSYVNEYAGLSAYRSNQPHKAYHHLQVAIEHATDRPLPDQTNLLRTLAINLLQSGKHAEAQRTIDRAFRIIGATDGELSRLHRARLHLTASGVTVARLYGDESQVRDLQDGKRHLREAQQLLRRSPASETDNPRILALSHQARYLFADNPQRLDAVHRVLDRALELAQSHGYAWGRANTLVSRARIHLRSGDPEAALADLKEADRIAQSAHLRDLQPLILHYQVEAATELNQPALALDVLNRLGSMDTPTATQHHRQASLAYASRFSASPSASWLQWLGLFLGGGLLVAGGVIAGTHLAPTVPSAPNTEAPTQSNPVPTGDALSDGPSPQSTSPSVEYVDTRSEPEELGKAVRMRSSEASSIAREVPWFRDAPSRHPLDAPAPGDVSLPEDPEARSREHRRLLFALWGLPPYGTQEAVGLPAYLEDGTALGYRSVTADQIQRALSGRLFLYSTSETTHHLFLLRRASTRRVLSADEKTVPPSPTTVATPIQGLSIAEVSTPPSDGP